VAVPALVVAGLLLIALGWMAGRPTPPAPVTRYRVALADGQPLSGITWTRLAVSPDGATLVYVGNGPRGQQLFSRRRGELEATPLPGTEGAINPAFSPDGNRVAYMDGTGRSVRVVSLAGGPPVTITDSTVGAPGVAWGPDGFIYYDALGIGPLLRVSETGGASASVGRLDSARGEMQHSWPDVLPNGRGVIMTASRGGPGAMGGDLDDIAVLDLNTGEHRVLFRGVRARYARSGHLVYVTADGSLLAVPFDQDRMEVTGDPVALAAGIAVRTGGGGVDLALSATGTLWYVAGDVVPGGNTELVWVGRDGAAVPVIRDWRGVFEGPTLSPDGRRLAVSINGEGSWQVWTRELDQGPLQRISEGVFANRAAWSPDGRFVAYQSVRNGNADIWQRAADGSRPSSELLADSQDIPEVTFTPDGRWIVYRLGSSDGQRDLYARMIGTDSVIPLVATSANESSPAVSPDGRWLAYVSDESGSNEVYVRPFPNTADGRWQVSTQGGQEPVWAHSGRELFYRTGGLTTSMQMVMSVAPGRTFQPGERRALFPLTAYQWDPVHQQYAVSRDDRRFVMIRQVGLGTQENLIVVENLFEELRARVPRR